MERSAMSELVAWKKDTNRLPLLVQGPRQVGKTWLVKEFARQHFGHLAYISFFDNEAMKDFFSGELSVERLLDGITLATGVNARSSNVLIFLDEIQECPRALMALKTFAENCPDVPIIAAGSLLGVALHRGASYPVGKVDHLFLYPLTFDEFLLATNRAEMVEALRSHDPSLTNSFRDRYTEALRSYYYVGGMPEAVKTYVQTRDFAAVRKVQDRLLFDYEHDFSKYADALTAERIRMIWASLPGQLARENKKFLFSAVKEGARARGYEEAVQWLVDAGLVLRVNRITKPNLPLSTYEDRNAFKLYFFDVGLLGAASRLPASILLEGDTLFTEFKGALTENYVCQALMATGKVKPSYWSAENSSGEVDFVYDYDGTIVPVEVKAETNLRAKSLRLFVERNHLGQGLRLSLNGFAEQEWVVNMPLYAVDLLPEWFNAQSKS